MFSSKCRSSVGKDVKKREDELVISSEGGACCSAN